FTQPRPIADMPTDEQIQQLNRAVAAVAVAEKAYRTALEKCRESDGFDSAEVDRALVQRNLARQSLELAQLASRD
ncbi:MAG: hypothetical protein ACKO15_06975, partial [Burkholderiales bacterium]